MTLITSSRLAGLLTRRSRATVAAFVADCYTARGWTTRDRSDGFVARDSRTGRTERVVVLGARTGLTAPDRVDADVVVARRDAAWARDVASASGARLLGPAQLRDLLLYGVGRERAAELLADHFGAALERRPGRVRAETLAVTFAFLVVVAGTAGGVAALLDAGRVDSAPAASAGTTPGPTTPAPTPVESGRPEPNTVDQFPTGVDDDGVRSVERLANAHRAAVDDESYTLVIEVRRSTLDGGQWQAVRQRATVENRATYTRVIEESNTERTLNGFTNRYEQYADGQRVYSRSTDADGDPVYSVQPLFPEGGTPFTRITTTYLVNNLDTSQSDLSRVVYRGREVYMVSGTGNPERMLGNVTDYRAVAILYPDGFVTALDVEYNVTTDNQTYHMTLQYTYDDVGTANVVRPEWVDNVNETTPAAGPD